MSFFEFLLAAAGKQMYDMVKDVSFSKLTSVHSRLTEYLRQYYFTGGMPEAVRAFVGGASLKEIRQIQKQILSDYNDDISKHAPSEYKGAFVGDEYSAVKHQM